MTKKIDPYDLQHLRNIGLTEQQIEQLYDETVKAAVAAGLKIADFDPEKAFSFADYPAVRKKIDRIIRDFARKLEATVTTGATTSFRLSNEKNDALVKGMLPASEKLTEELQKRYFAPRSGALEAFLKRKTNGLGLSERVWNYSNQFKQEIESALELGLKEGKSAAKIAKDLKQYLRYPDKLFRRVRDEKGNLQPSKAAKAFRAKLREKDENRGRGIYSSSYRNARRLAVTETNAAYAASDYERWQNLDFVVGIEVHLSDNHTLNGEAFVDVCDDLQGKYPKSFKFTGWHPLCRCYATTILKPKEQFETDLKNGTNTPAPNEVKDVPQGFKDWVAKNQERIKAAEGKGTLPWFLKENERFYSFRKNGIFNSTYPSTMESNLVATERLDISKVQYYLQQYAAKNKNIFKRGFVGVEYAPVGEHYFMSTDAKGRIFINFAKNKNGFDAGTSLVSAFNKIENDIKLTFHEEYAIEMFWHEILHNKTKNTAILPPINSIHGFSRSVAETINQLVARKTYSQLLEQLGGKAIHTDWVLQNGYGYKATVENMRKLLDTLNIDEDLFVKKANKLLMQDYTDFDKKIGDLIVKLSKRKDTGNVIDIYNLIENKDFEIMLLNFIKGEKIPFI